MHERYDHALAASLAIMDEMEARPGMAKHELLSLLIYTFLHALDDMDEGRVQKAEAGYERS